MKKITVLLLFISFSGFSQTLQEGFEGVNFPPTTPAPGWVVFQNAFGPRPWGTSIVSHLGLGAAQMNSRQNIGINNTSKDYLVTPLVTIPANGQLRFWARTEGGGNQGTLYQVRVASGANVANQTDEAAFNVAPTNLIQQWTEDEISTTYNVYEEKVVNFPAALIGTSVYIAFVNEYTQTTTGISGDTWYLDDVLLVSRCLDPTVLTANPVLSTSATLGWTNNMGPTYGNPCNQWEIEIVPSSQLVPSGSGIIVNTNPYIATTLTTAPFAPLLPLTSYKYYVRSICTFSSSLWAGPFSFTTSAAPPQCGGNFVDSGGTTASYSSNESITTTICPTLPGQFVTVNFASFAAENNFDFLKIYNGTSSTSPLLGNFTGTTNPGSFTSTSDTGCLTFVFTSDTSVNSAGWVASITCSTPPTCIQPTALASSNITTDSATLAWTSPGAAASWQVLALPCGAPAPTPTSTGWLPATTNSLVLPLTQATCYDLYVRGVCSTTDSSLWSGPKTITTIATCQQPTALTTTLVTATTATLGWTNAGLATEWQVLALPCAAPAPTSTSTGWLPATTNSLLITGLTPTTCYNFYVRGVCTPTDSSLWSGPSTATTQVAPPVCGGAFFDAGGTANYPNNSNSTVTICPTNPGDVVTVTFTAFNTEATWDGLYVFNGSSVTSPQIASANPPSNVPGGLAGSYWGTTIPGPFTSTSPDGCLTFNFRSDGALNNPGWTANITCAPAPTCLQPTALTTSVVTAISTTLGWTNAGIATAWQVLALPCTAPAPTPASTGWLPATTNSLVITGLIPATCYNFYVRGVCSPTDSSAWSGPKTATTQVAPPVCGGNFLDAGGTANYPNNSNSTVTICPTNPGEIVTVTFTSFNTEVNWDGLYVFDGNSVTSPQIASANPPANVPGGLAGSYWGTTIPGPFTSTSPDGCLTFNFRSDGTLNNPGWTANITCSPAPPCARPIQLTATSVTQTSASLSWTQPQNPNGSLASEWEILVLPAGSPVPTATSLGIATTSPYIAQGLNPGTPYTFYVRALCSATQSSEWSALIFASLPTNDECSNATFAIVNQNLNCVQTNPGTLAGATASNPITTCPGVANDDVWYSFTATAATHIISFNNIVPTTTLNYAIFQGTDCGALTQVGCNSGANLVPGTTYFIRVYSATAIPQYSTFNMCIGTLPCSEAPAFCTGQTITYANATNVPSLGTIGCLTSSPNPAFFFLQVNQAGPLSYLISQVNTAGAPIDVDYAAWGPFTDLTSACSGVPGNPLTGILPAPTPAQGCPGTLHACSFSAAPQEIICVPSAQLCQVYVIMITNFANQAGTVTFTQTNAGTGGGATECFPINTFNYSSAYYCQNAANPTPILGNGASNGTYSSTPGLDIDTVTGTINLATSIPGPYIVTSTTFTSTLGICTTIPTIVTTRTVVITAPASATISYSPNAFCNSVTTAQNVTQSGTTNGTYSATPAGLLISPFNGAIIPRASLPGIYTVTYTIQASGGCPTYTTSTTVEIIEATTPTFDQVAPICPGNTLADLPNISNNGITGSWQPAMNNTATTTYTFTPTLGICAKTKTMTIGVGSTTPTFDQVAPICPGAALENLPTTSNNGIIGTWFPNMNNLTTTTYTFTPSSGLCSGAVQMTIQILAPTITPTFTSVAPICPNGTISNLLTTSNNGITGIWSPALNNMATTLYTFTPNIAQCALTTTLSIIVNPELVVTVNNPSFCPGSTATVTATPAIPGTYTYTWTVPAGITNPGNVASFNTSTVGSYSVVISQLNTFCNTDFETPIATGAFPNLFNENLVTCWDTTGADGIIEIWPPGFEGVTAYSGNQLIELNANTPGTLFQDFSVIPGTSIAVQFAHRGRQGNDVVGVEIGPVGGPYVSLGNFTDGNSAWGIHAVNYTIPMGSGNNYTLRFVSVSSTGGNPSVGNLLDSISISSLSCPSQATSGTVSLQNLPAPTVTLIQPTCTVQTGTIEVTSPVSSVGGIIPNNLFISEVTDEDVGSLTYIEIFNGTGATVDLSNYKLKVYNNGGTTASCNNQLSGLLNNNSTFVVGVGSITNQGGIVPNLVFAGCGGVNSNDNIRLTTNSGTEIDLWGDLSGVNFTPLNQAGYTYRRNVTAVVPSITWNPADWTALDPQNYSNVGSYSLTSSNYEYSLDGGTYQSSTTFTVVSPGIHTIIVHDLVTGCYSLPYNVTINPVPQFPSVTTISYATSVCQNAILNPTPNTSVIGFTAGGTYTSNPSTGIDLNASTGQINLANTTAGTYVITYAVINDPATCLQGGSSPFTIVINPIITPVTTINYASPVCVNATNNPTQTITSITAGGTYYSATLGTSLNSASGVIDLSNINAIAESHTITYSVNANPATCQVANSSNAIIVINPIITPVTGFDYLTPICAVGSMSMPRPTTGFTTGGTYSSTSGLSISSSTGEINSTNSSPGNYIVTYSVSAVSSTCQVPGNAATTVIISNPVEVTIFGECAGSNYTLTANAVGSSFDPNNVVYSWADASGLAIGTTQTITVTNPENYTVFVLSNGCTGAASLMVSNTTCRIQKGISPNGDGDNETFILTDVKELSIFNRYGSKVYSHGANYTDQWHGQSNSDNELPDGTYFYVIKRGSGDIITGWIYINR